MEGRLGGCCCYGRGNCRRGCGYDLCDGFAAAEIALDMLPTRCGEQRLERRNEGLHLALFL